MPRLVASFAHLSIARRATEINFWIAFDAPKTCGDADAGRSRSGASRPGMGATIFSPKRRPTERPETRFPVALTCAKAEIRGSASNCCADALDPLGSCPAHEDPRAREAGGRLQHQDPDQGGRVGGRARQRQDVDESVRRDRRRGSASAEGGGQGDRGCDRLDRAGAGERNHPHRARHGGRPRHPDQGRRARRTARSRQAPQGRRRRRRAGSHHHGQAGDRRRLATRPARCSRR